MHSFTSAQLGPRAQRRALLLFCAVFALSRTNPANAGQMDVASSPYQATSGTLYFPSEDGRGYLAAPVLETDVEMTITGLICRATLTQRFANPTGDWIEGLYVFPLPEMAAVDGMKLIVSDRVIEGQIQPREVARRTYETAKSDGKKTSLVEQHRPNLFTTSVANIGPGEEVSVEIHYQQTLHFDAGGYRLRFPMVVAPRYTPGLQTDDSIVQVSAVPDSITLESFSQMFHNAPLGHGGQAGPPWLVDWLERIDALPPSASRVASGDPIHRVRIKARIDAGFPIEAMSSPSHAFTFDEPSLNERELDVVAYADRDFVLKWRLAPAAQPRVAIFAEQSGQDTSVLMMVLPPHEDFKFEWISREVVFVIDTSGSMGGASIRQARSALLMALDRLQASDSFNLIAFDSTTRRLFDESRLAGPDELDRARQFIASLRANGGTEMLPAIEQALDTSSDQRPGHGSGTRDLRQVIFMTDGSIGNEEKLFATVQKNLGRSRLFAVGIGSAPNGYFLERIAKFGRGTFTFIASPAEVQERMGGLFEKLERTALRDIDVHWNDDVEMWPERVPDLYAGEPLVVTARVPRFVGDVLISGRLGDHSWETRLPFTPDATETGIGKLWAREKIASLMDSVSAGADRDAVREEVTAVALDHHLVSKFTSLVAVDVTPTRPVDDIAHRMKLPLNTPRGWKHAGGMPSTATPASLLLLSGLASLLAAGLAAKMRR